jgi:hypothetical protein
MLATGLKLPFRLWLFPSALTEALMLLFFELVGVAPQLSETLK